MRQRKLKDLRAPNYNGTDDEWSNILRYTLVSKQDSELPNDLKHGLEVSANVTGNDGSRIMTITLRNRIDQITQKLGSIGLKETTDEIQLFDWASQAVDQQTSIANEVATLRTKAEIDKATVSALQAQLADLVQAKADHEEQLISKFALLLNEKKVAIRNQQRLVGTAKVDNKKMKALQRSNDGAHKGTASRGSRKRKSDAVSETKNDDDDDSEAFVTMEVDNMREATGDAQDSRETTPDTESGADDEEGGADVQILSRDAVGDSRAKVKDAPASSPPPSRSLPFKQKNAKGEVSKKKTPEPALGSDEETASEDDEL